ncbi:MAG: RNA methyltransferase [Simkaniaceae bacterium]|nr:RNA methyltransferase [Simkaniaceae bacterium]
MSKTPQFLSWIEKIGPARIISALSKEQSDRRLARIDQMLANRLSSIQVAVESPKNFHNAYAIVRTAEGMGLSNMHIIDPHLRKRSSGKATTQGAINWVDLKVHKSLDAFSQTMEDMAVVGGTMHGEYSIEELPIDRPLCLLFGNEEFGLTNEALERCDMTFHIPMYGMSQSYNLSVSAAIALHAVVSRKRKETTGELRGETLEFERAWALFRALGHKRAHAALSMEEQ